MIQKKFLWLLLIPVLLLSLYQSDRKKQNGLRSMVNHPDWSYNKGIYEVNLRQYSSSGTFKGFEKHLPGLKEMGVGILWFMPIHPIGEKNRKGSLGSYYSVKDYMAVNPEHGTMDEFKQLVKKIHEMGMYIILDWVANHTAWDNSLLTEHPEWYTRDSEGNFLPPVQDWFDVVDLDYNNTNLQRYMIDAMKFWVRDVDIDGFRCDVAEMVPLEFWDTVREELESIKPVFMLAEGTDPHLHDRAFDMTYNWDLFYLMNDIAQGQKTANDLNLLIKNKMMKYPKNTFRMCFTTNHDENSWNGTVFERLGAGAEVFAVLSCTFPGMPLVYSGQEAGLNKRLNFFERDPIEWKDHKFKGLYTKLLNLKINNRALWNGERGGAIEIIHTNNDKDIVAFIREKGDNKLFIILNLSGKKLKVYPAGDSFIGDYTDLFTNKDVEIKRGNNFILDSWGYKVFTK